MSMRVKTFQNINKTSENMAKWHNEGLKYIEEILNSSTKSKNSSIKSKESNILNLTVEYTLSCKFNKFRELKSTNVNNLNLRYSISEIMNHYSSYKDLSVLMTNDVKFYAEKAIAYMNDTTINIQLIVDDVLNDKKLDHINKLALCGFVKTIKASVDFWGSRNNITSKSMSNRPNAESVVLADCYYLWFGTLSGGNPLVGLGAGVLASAITGLS